MPLPSFQSMSNLWSFSTAQTVIETAAILSFATSGVLEAARKKFDLVGVCMVMGLTAFGGGTLRDLLLDRRPFFWVEHSAWLWVFLALGIGAMLVMRSQHFDPTEQAIQWPDALGLGLFAAIGTQVALAVSMPAIVAVLMGTITSVFGGVLRDIVCNEIPVAFTSHRPYGVCAFAGSWCVVAANYCEAQDWVGLLIGASVTFLLRAIAMVRDWRLPSWRAN